MKLPLNFGVCYNSSMKITKFEHSGFMVEDSGKILLCDPVEFENHFPNLMNVIAIIVTHKHNDHLQPGIIGRFPNAKVFSTIDSSMLLPNAVIAQDGSIQDVENFHLEFFGESHTPVVDGKAPCQNVGVVINDTIVNPGDSFDLPAKFDTSVSGQATGRPKVLFAPLSAPWCKISETVDFVRRARPENVIPFHDSVLSELGKGFNNNVLKSACEDLGANFAPLKVGESLTI